MSAQVQPQTTTPQRTDKGQFPAGVSGNPAGRPVGKKNEITDIQQELELAIRKHFDASKLKNIVDKLVSAAENGSIQAARLLLDKVLPNARSGEENAAAAPTVLIKIENTTQGAKEVDTHAGRVIENGT